MGLANELRTVAAVPVIVIGLYLVRRALRAWRHRRDLEATWKGGE